MSINSPEIGQIHILVVDDNAAIHEDFRKIFHHGSAAEAQLSAAEALLFGDVATPPASQPPPALHFASQGQAAAQMVQRAVTEGRPYAIAFIDMRMPPGWDGLETIEHLWAVDRDLQIVICSAHSDYDWQDVVGRLGTSDRLLVLKKPFEPIEVLQCASALSRKWQNERTLRANVESLERAIALRTEGLESANRQLRHLATHDALTDLPNRVLLDDRLAQAITCSQQTQQPFAVLMLDLGRFKAINDSLGHGAGDAVLKEIAERLTTCVRGVDTVARVGGDEFVVVITPPTNEEEVDRIGRRISETLSAPLRVAGVDLHIGSSIGVAFFPRDGSGADNLLAHADAAMYCAKRNGRNCIVTFAPGMDEATSGRMALESELHQALQLQQFELHYQPKPDAATGEVHSAEALIRWRHPRHGLMLPGTFIPLAEECGVIDDIGAWVLHEACRQCAAWQRAGVPPLRIAVNVAASQFRHGNLLEVIRGALAKARLAPQYLEIELTESAVMTDPEQSTTVLEELSRMGILVSVDDFGTGYSSMSYLRRFPIDKLKIDGSFVKDLAEGSEHAPIVQAIISLAHGLRLKAVAEGVETSEQLRLLKALGCDQYQGHHFSPALPAEQFASRLRDWRQSDAELDAEFTRTHSKLAAYRG